LRNNDGRGFDQQQWLVAAILRTVKSGVDLDWSFQAATIATAEKDRFQSVLLQKASDG
jgi:hypothetical protein